MKTNRDKKTKPGNSGRYSEEEHNEYQAKFKVLFENVCSGVAIYEARNDGKDFVFVDFNPAAEQIEHIKKEELIGKENYVYRLPSGQIIAIYDDVSTRKRTELVTRMTDQCFRAIADYTYDWEVWVGPPGRVLWTNPAAQRVTGYTVKEIMAMSDYPSSIVYEQDRDRIERAFRSALRGGTGNDVQFRIVRKDGKIIWVEMSWQPIYDDDGNSLGHRESIRDITARKEAEEELEKVKLKK
jgi:PAS domain S-box-containing protein